MRKKMKVVKELFNCGHVIDNCPYCQRPTDGHTKVMVFDDGTMSVFSHCQVCGLGTVADHEPANFTTLARHFHYQEDAIKLAGKLGLPISGEG